MPAQNQRRRPSLTAEFGTAGDARAAMEALENRGIVGAAVFGIVGLIVGVAGAPAGVIVASVLLGVALGGAVGAFLGVERGVGMSEDWEKTFEEPAAAAKPMRIGVYTNGKAETMRARHVLEHHRPLDIQDQTTGSGT